MIALLSLVKSLDFKWWAIIGLVAALGVMSATLWIKSVRIDSLKNEIGEKQVEISIYKQNIGDLKFSIEKQNKAVATLVEYTENVEVTLASTAEQNRKLNSTAQQLLKHISGSFVPPDCAGAVEHLNNFTTDFAKTWNLPPEIRK